jgi:hypothetical protein
VYAATVVLALPLAIAMRGLLQAHLGSSLAAESAAEGVNYDWWQEFASQTTGVGATFTPVIIGFAATLDNISSVLDGQSEAAPIVAALGLYLLTWTFLAGGIIDRYARQRPTRAVGFFAASGVHFFRLLRLAAVAGVVYWWLFAYVHRWLFLEWFVERTRVIGAERDVFLWRLALYAVFGLVLVLVNVIFDYAKIRVVVEDRQSVLGALSAATRFVRRRFRRVAGLYALNGTAFVTLIAIWALVDPGARGGGLTVVMTVLAAQLYLAARLALKLQFIASETALFQSSLAHAGYAAAPVPAWPESPSAELLSGCHPLTRYDSQPAFERDLRPQQPGSPPRGLCAVGWKRSGRSSRQMSTRTSAR